MIPLNIKKNPSYAIFRHPNKLKRIFLLKNGRFYHNDVRGLSSFSLSSLKFLREGYLQNSMKNMFFTTPPAHVSVFSHLFSKDDDNSKSKPDVFEEMEKLRKKRHSQRTNKNTEKKAEKKASVDDKEDNSSKKRKETSNPDNDEDTHAKKRKKTDENVTSDDWFEEIDRLRRKSGFNSSSRNRRDGKNNGPKEPSMAQIAAYVAITLSLIYFMSSANSGRSKEITWHDFETRLLRSGKVDRLVIKNKETCHVYLKPYVSSQEVKEILKHSAAQPELHLYNSISAVDENLKWQETFSGDETVDSSNFVTFGDKEKESNFGSSADMNEPQRSSAYQKRLAISNLSRPAFTFSIGSVDSFEAKLQKAQENLKIPVSDYLPVQYVSEESIWPQFLKILPSLLSFIFIASLFFAFRNMSGGLPGGGGGSGGGLFGVSKSKAKKFNPESGPKITFNDVAGCDEAKVEILEFVEFLQNKQKFVELGAKIPRGALLVGPPGTGKTLLAKATAGEASVPFYSVAGSDFIEMFVGVGPARVRDLFKTARKDTPCIIFIDEIDAIARKRSSGGFSGGNDERENTLNQLLVEMDGFDTEEGVVILAGTNRADVLDPAILRPGRFDRRIQVELPDISGRKEIFLVHLKGLKTEEDKEGLAQRLASLSPGVSGAQIASICNEAAILAARKNRTSIDAQCFEEASDRIIAGLEKKNALITPEVKRTIAYHEAGHAVVGWFLEHADPLLKVTIIPRMSGALGFAQYLPKEVALHTEEQLLDRMSMTLGGRAAEEITFGKVTSGAHDDLDKVTKLAYNMVSKLGMNKRLGNISFNSENNGYMEEKQYSEKTAEMIDEEVSTLIKATYERTKELLTKHQDSLKMIAEKLLDVETISQHDIAELIGPRPFATDETYSEFLEK